MAELNEPPSAAIQRPGFKSLLDEVCWLELSGRDSADFLQAQLTSDISSLEPSSKERNTITTQLGAWCSPKGRVLCLFRVVRLGTEHYALRMPTSLVDAICKRLRMFVLRRDVSIRPVGWQTLGFALSDEPDSRGLPATSGSGVQLSNGFAYKVEGDLPRWEAVSFSADLKALQTELALSALAIEPASTWRLHDIRSRIPYIDEATTDKFVPQMLGLHTIGAVSFDKGCYPGQEIVARTQYRGTLKRHLASMVGWSDGAHVEPPSPGLRIFAGREGSEAVAEVVLAEPTGDSWEMLAVIKSDAPPPAALTVQLGDKPILAHSEH